MPTPSQLEELRSLNARIEEFNREIRKEGPVIDKLQEHRGKAVKLERQAKAGRLRKRSLARRGAKGRAIHKHKRPKEADELEEIYDRMDSLDKSLDKIEALKDKRIPYIERRRAVLKEISIATRVPANMAQKIKAEKEQLEYIRECIDRIRHAKKLLKRAASIMKSAKEHISKAKTASFFDIVGVGGVAGELAAEYVKHKSMGRARTAMAPAQRCIRQANKILKSLDLRGSGAGPSIPQLNAFLDIAMDGWFDIAAHDKISQAEFSAEMSTKRVARRAKELETIEDVFHQQYYRLESSVYELYLDAESFATLQVLKEAQQD